MKQVSVLFVLVLVIGSGVSSPLLNLLPTNLITNIVAPVISVVTNSSSVSANATANATTTTNTSPITSILNTVTNITTNVLNTTLTTITTTLNTANQALTSLSNNLLQNLNVTALASVEGSLNLNVVNAAIQNVAEQLQATIAGTVNANGTVNPAIINVVLDAVNSIAGGLTNISNISPADIQNAILNSVNQLKQNLTSVINSGIPINSTSLQTLISEVQNTLLSIPDTIISIVDSLLAVVNSILSAVTNLLEPIISPIANELTNNIQNQISNLQSQIGNITSDLANKLNIDPATLSSYLNEIVNMISSNVTSLSPEEILNLISSISANGSLNLNNTVILDISGDLVLKPFLINALSLINNTVNDAGAVITQINNTVSDTINQIKAIKAELINELNFVNSTACASQWGPAINNVANSAIDNTTSCLYTEINHYQNALNVSSTLSTEISAAIQNNQITLGLVENIAVGTAIIAAEVGPTLERFKLCEGIAAVSTGISIAQIVAGIAACAA